jgi:acetyl-CoA carboxylase carboxyltransferase component
MAGLPYAPILQLATPLTRLAVMEGRTLAIGAFGSKLDDDFKIVAATPKEAEEIARGMEAVEARIGRDMDPVLAASQRDVDEIVTPGELRLWIASAVEMAYQAIGARRVKNPRISSFHDLERLAP